MVPLKMRDTKENDTCLLLFASKMHLIDCESTLKIEELVDITIKNY